MKQDYLPRGRNSYRLNPQNYCRIINDRVRCASLTRSSYYIDNPFLPEFKFTEKPIFENRPCGKPFVVVKKWKHWLVTTKSVWLSKKCEKCPFFGRPMKNWVINTLIKYEKPLKFF